MRDLEKQKIWQKKYKEDNKEKIKEYMKEYRKGEKDIKKKHDKKYYDNNKERLIKKAIEQNKKEIRKVWLNDNKEYISIKNKEYKLINKEKIKEYSKNYRNNNKDILNENRRNRMKLDPLYKLSSLIRNSIRISLNNKGFRKTTKTEKILGYSYLDFKIYLESKFKHWMSWINHGLYDGNINYGWDIDHIIPLSNGKTEEEIIKLNHYTNLQPLCSYTNRYVKKNYLL